LGAYDGPERRPLGLRPALRVPSPAAGNAELRKPAGKPAAARIGRHKSLAVGSETFWCFFVKLMLPQKHLPQKPLDILAFQG
jgi:hypothetical protein